MTLQTRMANIVRKPAAQAPEDVANKRFAKRKPVTTSAKILFDGITTPFDCVVKDISSTGAQIEISRTKFNPEGSADAIPHYFTLINPLDRTAVDCHSMWRRGSKIGARFVGMVRSISQPRPTMKRPAKK